jgi:putative acetyltransferase
MVDYRIVEDDLWEPEIVELLELHLPAAHGVSPPGSVHALSIERLRQPDVTLWSVWDGDELAACGALKELDSTHGEIKAMRAAPEYRGKGAGRAVLEHIIAEAEARGYARLSFETGRTEDYVPARALYEAYGFTPCAAFADYVLDDFSICMSRAL